MTELERAAGQRMERITAAVCDVLAERYGVYDSAISGDEARVEMRDYYALDPQQDRLNDIRVRVHIESADVVSVYVFGIDEGVLRSARLTQMPETAVAVLVAHELTRDGADVESD